MNATPTPALSSASPRPIIRAARWPAWTCRELESRAFELGGGTYEHQGNWFYGDFAPANRPLNSARSHRRQTRRASTDLASSLPEYAITAIRIKVAEAVDKQNSSFYLGRTRDIDPAGQLGCIQIALQPDA